MSAPSPGVRNLLRRPSAFVPFGLSLAAFAVVIGHVAIHGGAREVDEGAAAHLWQLAMAGQVPFVVAFGVRWMRHAPRAAGAILLGQLAAAAVAAAPVFLLGL